MYTLYIRLAFISAIKIKDIVMLKEKSNKDLNLVIFHTFSNKSDWMRMMNIFNS